MTSFTRKLFMVIGKALLPKIELTPTQKSFIEQVQRGDIIIHEIKGMSGTGFRIERNPDSIKIDPELSKRLASLCKVPNKP